MLYQHLLSVLEIGAETEERQQRCLLHSWKGDWQIGLGGMKRRMKIEDLQLAYLLCWLNWSVGSQGIPIGVGDCDKGINRERKFGGVGL